MRMKIVPTHFQEELTEESLARCAACSTEQTLPRLETPVLVRVHGAVEQEKEEDEKERTEDEG